MAAPGYLGGSEAAAERRQWKDVLAGRVRRAEGVLVHSARGSGGLWPEAPSCACDVYCCRRNLQLPAPARASTHIFIARSPSGTHLLQLMH